MKTFYIIDISSFFFRSYYAVPSEMTNSEGLSTNALYGTLSMLLKLLDSRNPDYIAVCFDTKVPSFRKDIFPEYKANREEMPKELEKQVPYLKKMIRLLNIAGFEREGYEADDLIGTLARQGRTKGLKVFIVSGDKDFAQLVDEHTVLLDTMKSKMYDRKAVCAKWGVYPEQMIDWQALVGDSSDNIPGVRGIGPKGAEQLLKAYGDIDTIYSNINEIKKNLQTKLKEGKKECFLSKQLVTIVRDVEITCRLSDLIRREPQKVPFREFLKDLGFNTFLRNLYPEEKPVKKRSAGSSLQKIKILSTGDPVRDIEPYSSLWIWSMGEKLYFARGKKIIEPDLSKRDEISQWLDQKWVRWSGYDLKACWKKLDLKNPIPEWDSMVAGHLLSSRPAVSFLSLCGRYLKEDTEETPLEFYQAHQNLKEVLLSRLKTLKLDGLFRDMELPLIPVLYEMEKRGMALNIPEVKRQSEDLEKNLARVEKDIFQLCGETFNIASPKQLGGVLFDKLKLPAGRKTKSGRSTDNRELLKLKKLNPVIPLILEYREIFKLKTTYTSALISLAHPKTGRVHTCFKQTATSTGRLSSVNPNLQNIPVKTERGLGIRRAFTAPPGSVLISADYSQIELRVLAHITEDPGLCRAFQEGQDIHSATACEIFHKPLKEITPELRRKSKAVNFGIAYGQGAFGLSESLGISRAESKGIIESYFKKFKGVRDYIETVKENIHKKGYVETLFGRKRFFSDGELNSPQMRSAVERAAVNAPIQGTASEIVKKAMIELEKSLPIPLVSQVHDELIFECPKGREEREQAFIVSIMENCVPLKAPLKVNCVAGAHWASAHF